LLAHFQCLLKGYRRHRLSWSEWTPFDSHHRLHSKDYLEIKFFELSEESIRVEEKAQTKSDFFERLKPKKNTGKLRGVYNVSKC